MTTKRIETTRHYEQAIKEVAEIYTGGMSEMNSRLNALHKQIDAFESRVWTKDLFTALH